MAKRFIWTTNKWKKYVKTDKKNIVKYFKCTEEINNKIVSSSDKFNISQSALICEAVMRYLIQLDINS